MGPVTTVTEHMQLRIADHVEQLEAGFKWDHAVFAPMDKERLILDFGDAIFVGSQGIHLFLTWLGPCRGHMRVVVQPLPLRRLALREGEVVELVEAVHLHLPLALPMVEQHFRPY